MILWIIIEIGLKRLKMAKRFTDSGKFRDNWYRKLTPNQKCLWEFIISECSLAGIIDIDFDSLEFHIGAKITIEDFEPLNERIYTLPDGKVFIPKFITFQQKELNENNRAHKNIIENLSKYGIDLSLNLENFERGFKGASKGLSSPAGNSIGKGNGLGNGKSTGKGNKGLLREELNNILASSDICEEIKKSISDWLEYKNFKYAKKGFETLLQVIKKKIAKYGLNTVMDLIEESISRGWEGICWKKLEDDKKKTKKGNGAEELVQKIADGVFNE